MRHKLGKILVVLVATFGFMININAETTIQEDVSKYEGDVYIIGSSKFDNNVIVTGTMASVAGAREAYIQYFLYRNVNFKAEDVKIYYYSGLDKTWSILPETSEDEFKELTEEEAKNLTDDLNVYYVNGDEKILEVPYEVELKEGEELGFYASVPGKESEVKYESGKLLIPATITKVDTFIEDEEGNKTLLDTIEQVETTPIVTSKYVSTYEELKAAIESTDDKIIKLGNSLDLPTALEISKKVVIDLNHNYLSVQNDTAGNGVFHVIEGGDLTINGEGTVDGVGNNKWNIAIFADGGKVTINGGLYTNVNAVAMPEDTDSNHFDLIYAKGNGQVIINGGYFEGKTPAWLLNLKDQDRSTASIIVNGGTFIGFNPADNKAEGEGTNFVAPGYKVEELLYEGGKDYHVTQFDGSEVAITSGIAYHDLDWAITNAKEGATVTLLSDVDLPTALEISKKVTIDLNGRSLTVKEDTDGNGVFHVIEGGDLTINGEGIIDGVGNNKWNIAIFADGGKVTINGGLYTNTDVVVLPEDTDSNHFDLIYAKGNGQVIINGGRFEGKTPAWLLNLKDQDRSTASIIVNGGTFVGFNPENNKAEGEGTSFVAPGYEVVEENGEYTVVKK